MSLNIKTSSGLQSLIPEVNKPSIIRALGYTPADEEALGEHLENSSLHLTAAQQAVLAQFTSDDSGNFIIADQHNNRAFQIDRDGTTQIARLVINNREIDPTKQFSGNFSDLVGTPEWISRILEDNSGNFTIADQHNNRAFEVTAEGKTCAALLHANSILLGAEEETKNIVDVINTAASKAAADLVAQAPEDLNTLRELAEALGEDPNFATTVTGLITDAKQAGLNAAASLAQHAAFRNAHGTTISDVTDNYVSMVGDTFAITDEAGKRAFEIAANGATRAAALEVTGFLKVGNKLLSNIISEQIESEVPALLPVFAALTNAQIDTVLVQVFGQEAIA